MVVYEQSGCMRQSDSIRAKGVLFGQSDCIREKLLYSSKSGLIGAKEALFVQNGCIWPKYLYSGKLVVFGQKWLYSGKS